MNFNATLIGQSISFIIFILFVMKYVWPILFRQMKDREARIADGLAAAEQGKKDFAEAQKESTNEVNRGKDQAAKIISLAQKRGDEIVEAARKMARKEGERIKENALNDIEQEKEKARQELRQEVAALVMASTEKILMREVDHRVHDEFLEKISRQL